MDARGILLTERHDLHNNKLVALLEGETLTVIYRTHDGLVIKKKFNSDNLREGLYRVAKICGWMYALEYTSAQRIEFLNTGTMA